MGTIFCFSPRTEVYNPKTFFPHAALLGQACAHCPIFPTAASRRSLDRLSVPMWPITLSGRLLIVDLVGRYLTNYLIRREPTSYRISPLTSISCEIVVSCGISTPFGALSPCMRQVAHALLTRPPLGYIRASSPATSFDLHVLSTPPAFVLSQDQTLVFNPLDLSPGSHPASISLIPELTVVLPLSLYRFQGSLAPPRKFPSRRALDYSITSPLICQHLFSDFFHFFSKFSFYVLFGPKTAKTGQYSPGFSL